MKDRIAFLDGHRGLAILLVIGYHAFSRWPSLIANDCCARFPLFELGPLGVQLFFLVSGFVILMTLERCESALVFLRRRWLRLFPAMLVCSLLIFVTVPLFSERPAGTPEVASLLPGWLFMDLRWLKFVIGHEIKPLEGSFWTLYVEVKFYIFAALVYFAFGRRTLMWSLFGVALAQYVVALLDLETGQRLLFILDRAGQDMGLENWFWFASGAAFYVHRQSGEAGWRRLALVGILAGAASIATPQHLADGFAWQAFAGALIVGAVFATSMVSVRVQAILDSRFLQFFGFVSYPLYLLHENMLVSLLVKLAPWVPREIYPLGVALALVPVVFLAWLVARHVEPVLRKRLARLLDQIGEAWSGRLGGSTRPGPDVR